MKLLAPGELHNLQNVLRVIVLVKRQTHSHRTLLWMFKTKSPEAGGQNKEPGSSSSLPTQL